MVCQEIHLVVGQDRVGCFYLYTTYFNRTFLRLAQWRPRFLKNWFTCGVFFGLVAMLLSVFLLTILIYNTLASQDERRATAGFDTSGKVFAVMSKKC